MKPKPGKPSSEKGGCPVIHRASRQAATPQARDRRRLARKKAGLLFLRHAVVPGGEHFFRRGDFQRTDDAEAEPLGIGVVPDALGKLRILGFPGRFGTTAEGAERAATGSCGMAETTWRDRGAATVALRRRLVQEDREPQTGGRKTEHQLRVGALALQPHEDGEG